MYSFESNRSGRKKSRTIRLLAVLCILLAVGLAVVSFAYIRLRDSGSYYNQAIMDRAAVEAGEAQTAVYRLTQSAGSGTISQLSSVRAHITAIACLNNLAQNIYGINTVVVDPELITACISMVDEAELRLQAGNVLTTQFTALRDRVDRVALALGLSSPTI